MRFGGGRRGRGDVGRLSLAREMHTRYAESQKSRSISSFYKVLRRILQSRGIGCGCYTSTLVSDKDGYPNQLFGYKQCAIIFRRLR